MDGSLVEGSSLDQGALFVNEVEVEELSAAPSVLPGADCSLFDDARLDSPVIGELVEGLDWHVGAGGPSLLDRGGGAHDRVVLLLLGVLPLDSPRDIWAGGVCALSHYDFLRLIRGCAHRSWDI